MVEKEEHQTSMQPMDYFHARAGELLTNNEYDAIAQLVKEYTIRRDLVRLLQGLKRILRTPDKHELLFPIRDLVAGHHVVNYDRFVSRLFGSNRKVRKLEITGDESGDEMVIYIYRIDGKIGMSIRGGSEHGLGIYISSIERGSLAEKCGLLVGDQIMEANNINLENMPSGTAIKVLTSGNRLKLTIKRTGRVPQWKCSTETTIWYNINRRAHEVGEESDHDEYEIAASMGMRDGLDRRVKLMNNMSNDELGFNIRGGKEFGVGIYVSSIDPQSRAEENGIKIGDKIIDVNGTSFADISHSEAVKFLRSFEHLILTVRDAGKYPVYKEVTAEFSWTSQNLKTQNSRSKEELYNAWLGPNIAVEGDYSVSHLDVETLSSMKAGSLSSFTFSTDEPLSTIPEVRETSSASAEQNEQIDTKPIDVYSFEHDSEEMYSHEQGSNRNNSNTMPYQSFPSVSGTMVPDYDTSSNSNEDASDSENFISKSFDYLNGAGSGGKGITRNLSNKHIAIVTPQTSQDAVSTDDKQINKRQLYPDDSSPWAGEVNGEGIIFVKPTVSEILKSERDIKGKRPHFDNCIDELKYLNKTYTTYPCEILQNLEINRRAGITIDNQDFTNFSDHESKPSGSNYTGLAPHITTSSNCILSSNTKGVAMREYEKGAHSSHSALNASPYRIHSDGSTKLTSDPGNYSDSHGIENQTAVSDNSDLVSVSSLSSINEADFDYGHNLTSDIKNKSSGEAINNVTTDSLHRNMANYAEREQPHVEGATDTTLQAEGDSSNPTMTSPVTEARDGSSELIPHYSSSSMDFGDTPTYAKVISGKFRSHTANASVSNQRALLTENSLNSAVPALDSTDSITRQAASQSMGSSNVYSQVGDVNSSQKTRRSVQETKTSSDTVSNITPGQTENSNINHSSYAESSVLSDQISTASGKCDVNNTSFQQKGVVQKGLPLNRRRRLSSGRPLRHSTKKASKKNKESDVVLVSMRALNDA